MEQKFKIDRVARRVLLVKKALALHIVGTQVAEELKPIAILIIEIQSVADVRPEGAARQVGCRIDQVAPNREQRALRA
ncbi:hypothetical protein E2553_39745 [Paraburkholderia dipogonis]|uniref:Uncharacterized protein n=1 Tax=Paraburkholderia dipogonis TaxID=1211383 RepID=A0A4Y8MJF1_9BURK|nr:hypothetical protein [Paraburkholderia dipogonis]TFE37561.1 hypothetical protein E2553_39745 [Paraburkholderia dipogonis]